MFIALYLSFECLAYTSLTLLKTKVPLDDAGSTLTDVQISSLKAILANDGGSIIAYSPSLGWTMKPNAKLVSGIYTSNSQGIRAEEDFDLMPKANIVRIAAFGDSFTQGDGVANTEIWTTGLRHLSPNLEVLNFGVTGYGLDQAYLRYQQDGVPFQPHIVLIGFMSDDTNRHVSVFRPFLLTGTRIPLTKPRYVLRDDGLVLLPNPFPNVNDYRNLASQDSATWQKILENDAYARRSVTGWTKTGLPSWRLTKVTLAAIRDRWFQKRPLDNYAYNKDSEAFRITLKLFQEFYRDSISHGSLPIILLFPNGGEIHHWWKTGAKPYAPVVDELNKAGYRYIDLMDAFEQYRGQMVDTYKAHYTSLGHAAVAKYLAFYLQKEGLTGLQGWRTAYEQVISPQLLGHPLHESGTH